MLGMYSHRGQIHFPFGAAFSPTQAKMSPGEKRSHGTTKESKQTWLWGSASRTTSILSMWQISGQLTSTHSPQESLYFWRTISPSRSKRSLTLRKRSRSCPILIIFLPSLYWNNTYIKTIQTKGQFRQVRLNRHVRSIMQKYTKVM